MFQSFPFEIRELYGCANLNFGFVLSLMKAGSRLLPIISLSIFLFVLHAFKFSDLVLSFSCQVSIVLTTCLQN